MNKNTLKLFFIFIPSLLFGQKKTEENSKANVLIDTLLSQKSLNRAWTHLEIQQALNDVVKQQKDTSYTIPTLTNDKKILFTKLTNYESYWFLNSKYYTLNDRFMILFGIFDPVKNLLMTYYQRSKVENGKLTYENEITELHNLVLKLTIDQVKLTDEFIATNPNLTEVQLSGLKKMIYGINTILSSDLTTLEKEYSYFSETSICKICNSFKEIYTFMYKKIDNATKVEFDKRIEDLIKRNEIQCITDKLKEN